MAMKRNPLLHRGVRMEFSQPSELGGVGRGRNPGRKGGRDSKGREEGVLRRWEAEGKCKTMNFYHLQCVRILSKQEPKNVILTSSETTVQTSKLKFVLGPKTQAHFRLNFRPFNSVF